LVDLVARERRTDVEAMVATGQVYTYHRFCTTAWQVGNFLRHLGVHEGVTVGIADDPDAAQPILTLFGTALLEGIAWIGAPKHVDARAVVAPVDEIATYELPDGGQRAGYGGDPDDSGTYHFEEEVWSENPTRVPDSFEADAAVLTDGARTYSHAELLSGAEDAINALELSPGDHVGVHAPLSDPRTVAAGVLAPLIGGGTIVLNDGADVDAVISAEETSIDRSLAITSIDLD
jgi:acyl-CoA synthetase (AMP-forming)/AMP-acid ligase II